MSRHRGFAHPSFADYVAVSEHQISLRPSASTLTAHQAGTIPEVGITSLFSLKRTNSLPNASLPLGSPWATRKNVTVVVTAGSGGTGFIGIQIAKAYGATHIITSTTGAAAIAFVTSLGATQVIDYNVADLFDSLPDDSVDFVYDNYAEEGTADKALRTIRSGGTYLMMPHGECYAKQTQGPPCLSSRAKAGTCRWLLGWVGVVGGWFSILVSLLIVDVLCSRLMCFQVFVKSIMSRLLISRHIYHKV
jgi:NADPH:quinone reductase-like Zn-dependent oxidoreductase